MSSGFDAPTLAAEHDCLLLDLDGTVYRGAAPITGARRALERIELRTLFLTNNAEDGQRSRRSHARVGFVIEPDDVITSAQTAARLLADELPCGSRVLVIGTDTLATEVANAGLVPVQSLDDAPTAVVRGHSPCTDWHDLAEAAHWPSGKAHSGSHATRMRFQRNWIGTGQRLDGRRPSRRRDQADRGGQTANRYGSRWTRARAFPSTLSRR